jgi:DNA replication protein DnaC|tara:strand:- start:588 stop:1211 length:624 start_codon:yes stop_codon:yes gene_type:complete
VTEWHGAKYWRNQSRDERTRLAEIPPSLTHARLSNYDGDHESVTKWLREFHEHRKAGVGLLFAGKHGSGKSHLAVAALRGAIRTYRQTGRYITANDYVRALDDERQNDGVLPDSYEEGNLIPYLRSMYDIVVLDDVDAIRQTSYAKREISDLLSSRCSKKLVTIISCHDGIDKLKFNVTAQFHGLVRASCVPVVLTSGDHRRAIRGT